MSRLTVNLPDELHQALKTAAARRKKSIGHLVQESLEAYGIKPEKDVEELLRLARLNSGLGEEEALDLAVEETRKHRG